jgi:GNAT superfamily N-acetyltransferase
MNVRNLINILTESRLDRIVEQRTSAWRKLVEAYPALKQRWETSESMVRDFSKLDPDDQTYRHTNGLISLFVKQPWDFEEYRYKLRFWMQKFSQLDHNSKISRDIASYDNLEQFISAIERIPEKVKKSKTTTLGNMSLSVVNNHGDGRQVNVRNSAGKSMGHFTIDLTYRNRGIATLHSSLYPEYQRRGFGSKIYDWVENYVRDNMNLKLRPSNTLTQSSMICGIDGIQNISNITKNRMMHLILMKGLVRCGRRIHCIIVPNGKTINPAVSSTR